MHLLLNLSIHLLTELDHIGISCRRKSQKGENFASMGALHRLGLVQKRDLDPFDLPKS